ncbi:MAG: aminotransferase class V-fold PLP-dependent enzyme, partial [Rikenellaceae bacterium]
MRSIDQIRGDFPILERRVYNKPLTYLDSGATAQKPQCVIERVNQLHSELNANIHRGVHFLSQEVTSLYEQARESVRRFIGAEHREEIIFTAGATAAINTVAYSWGESNLKEGDNIIISEMEHHSNIVPWQLIADRRGAQIRVLPFDDEGRLMVEALDELMDERT